MIEPIALISCAKSSLVRVPKTLKSPNSLIASKLSMCLTTLASACATKSILETNVMISATAVKLSLLIKSLPSSFSPLIIALISPIVLISFAGNKSKIVEINSLIFAQSASKS